MPIKLYCTECKEHTPHQNIPALYATACTKCGAHTSSLMRAQAESFKYNAPDGTQATVVENTPNTVTYYVPSGPYEGYYYYDKHTKAKQIRQ